MGLARLAPGPAGGLAAPGPFGWRGGGAGGAPLGPLPVLQLAARSSRAGPRFGEVWTHQGVFLLTLEIRDGRGQKKRRGLDPSGPKPTGPGNRQRAEGLRNQISCSLCWFSHLFFCIKEEKLEGSEESASARLLPGGVNHPPSIPNKTALIRERAATLTRPFPLI